MLVAVDRAGRPVGVVSDRDLAIRAIAESCDAAAPVRVVMSPTPRTIAEEAPIESALSLMTFGAVRRLPVVDRAGKLVGIIALDDVVALLGEELDQVRKVLGRQMPCRHGAEDPALGRSDGLGAERDVVSSLPSERERSLPCGQRVALNDGGRR